VPSSIAMHGDSSSSSSSSSSEHGAVTFILEAPTLCVSDVPGCIMSLGGCGGGATGRYSGSAIIIHRYNDGRDQQ